MMGGNQSAWTQEGRVVSIHRLTRFVVLPHFPLLRVTFAELGIKEEGSDSPSSTLFRRCTTIMTVQVYKNNKANKVQTK
ncbi:hypothetical protein NQ318_002171 [Aromia moschata]|uniref:Uncharacterized protein n=1 Tax=Aromia moschata TaxID=1265417 RepID=A0AAV8Z2K5_9CUCU|nr:hypothetical protein NQ318_002171 [Aromia moschata]